MYIWGCNSNVISEYIIDSEMKHVYLMNPFLWNEFETLEFRELCVAWLLIIPISEQEKSMRLLMDGKHWKINLKQ